MSIAASNWARDVSFPGMQGVDKTMLLVLATYANEDGLAWPSAALLSTQTGYSERHLRRSRQIMAAHGILTPIFKRGRVEAYQLNLRWRNEDYEPTVFRPRLRTRESASPDSGVRTCGLGSPQLRTPESAKRKVTERTRKGSASRDDFAADDQPPPPAPAPPQGVVGKRPASQPPRTANPPAATPKLSDILELWNRAADNTNLVPITRAPLKADWIMLQQACRHPALAEGMPAWVRYLGWVRRDPMLNGSRPGSYPAALKQVTAVTTIDRWHASTRPARSEVYVPIEPIPPDLPVDERLNYLPGFVPLTGDPAKDNVSITNYEIARAFMDEFLEEDDPRRKGGGER